jgi:hypothetical protein
MLGGIRQRCVESKTDDGFSTRVLNASTDRGWIDLEEGDGASGRRGILSDRGKRKERRYQNCEEAFHVKASKLQLVYETMGLGVSTQQKSAAEK